MAFMRLGSLPYDPTGQLRTPTHQGAVGGEGQNRRLLKSIVKGTIEAAQRSFEAEKE
jgi:hypothetical protein